ncbi:alpha/beta hydrolase family protein [Nocardia sp. NPDC051052]|uniref:alpha/beta hydrolase family protein n=1 Tax=Nocardia sp. NPDC051052 TaxID=3364322 RepID=UPI0037A51332
MGLGPADLAHLTCPLLVLHGTPDQVFLVENARALYTSAASPDKTWREWVDGDHCLYNHSLEKHTIVADWFADRLPGRIRQR